MAARLLVRQRGRGAASHDGFQLRPLRIGASSDQRLPHHQRAQQRLDCQVAAQAFEHHAHVKARPTKTTGVFGEQRADGAQLGQTGIHLF
jgi:hypothetical protein